jgi:hypothetical protein
VMSKAELAASRDRYDELMRRANEALSRGYYRDAMRWARAAWERVEDMMKYERRYEGAAFKTVPCIEMVLRLAPLRLDGESLDALEALLKQQRSIDKHASDDLAGEVEKARERMRMAYRVWRELEKRGEVEWENVVALYGQNRSEWLGLEREWARMELVEITGRGGRRRIRLRSGLSETVKVRCVVCGECVEMPKRVAVRARTCSSCGPAAKVRWVTTRS